MACLVRKPRSPYWMAKFRAADGRTVMRSTKQTDLRLARKTADTWEEIARKARAGELTMAAGVKLLNELLERTGERVVVTSARNYFTEWLGRKTTHGKASSTVKRYNSVVDGFLEFIGETRAAASVASITPVEIERFRDRELRAGKSASTANFSVSVLAAAFAEATRKGITQVNPALGIEALVGQSEERHPFTDDQVRDLMRASDNEWRGMILFGVHAGLRLTDAADLTWMNIDPVESLLTYRAKKTSGRKQGSDKDTVVILHSDLKAWCDKQPAGDNPSASLFPSLNSKRSGGGSGLSTVFSNLMKQARISVPRGVEKKGEGRQFSHLSFHSLRHTFISRLLNSDVLSDVRKSLVGHTSDEAHARYCHMDLSTQRRAIAKLSSVIPKGAQ